MAAKKAVKKTNEKSSSAKKASVEKTNYLKKTQKVVKSYLDDLNKEVEAIEANLKTQGGDLDSLLSFQGQTREDFRESLRTRILIKKILADKATVTDEEARKFFDENKTQFPANSKYEDVQGEVKETLVEEKIGQVYQEWIDQVKANSQVNYLLLF